MDLNVRGGAAQITGVSMRIVNGRIRLSSTSFFLATAFWCAGAYAQTLVHFDLPAQPLSQSLRAIGSATNTDVGFSASEVAGLLAPALKANLTVDGALTRVLVGTGLRPRHLDDHTIVISAANMSASGSVDVKLALAKASAPGGQPADDPHAVNAADVPSPSMLAQTNSSVPKDATKLESTGSSNAADQLEEIIVTGTHIRGIDNKTNPVIVIDRDQIDRSGYSSTQDLIRSLPQNFSSGEASEDGFLTGNVRALQNTDFASGVDLRGLGASSTLVLLNGHRLAPSASGTFVDVSQIPLAAIDRVEILTDGSSAIYGSDAVGGVVNIILKKDYQGADTMAKYGATQDGGRDGVLVAQTFGSIWSGGNAAGTVQFQRQDALPARDRNFASALPEPNDLLPQTSSYSATFDGRQSLTDHLEVYGDVLLSRRAFTTASSQAFPGLGIEAVTTDGDTRAIDVTPGLRIILSPRWSIELNGLYGYQKSTGALAEGFPGSILDVAHDNRFTEKSADLIVNGRLHATPAGDIGIAIGSSYRTEDLNTVVVDTPGASFPTVGARHVTAEFAELLLPIVGAANRAPMLEALELSAALRRDDYSDFGSTTNPHLGLRWAPWTDLSFRASYGKSFRAPSLFEESQEATSNQLIYIFQVASPVGPGVVPALIEYGSRSLTAERARTSNFGLEYKPSGIGGLTIALDYFDIRFQDRIIVPPIPFNFLQQPGIYGSLISPVASDAAAQAIVSAAEAAGAIFSDFYGNGVAGVRYLYDDRQQNAANVRQTGADLSAKFTEQFGAHALTSQLNVSFIDKIDTQFAPGASFSNQVNTVGSPVRWRARFDSAWGGKAWSLSGAVNAIGSYVNTAASGNPPIASWTTFDLNATLNPDAYFDSPGWRGFSLSLIVLNVLNRDPPYVMNATAIYPVNYDPTNANPLGRFVALALRKKW
jgi:iron complex outermembrane recepter protein